MYPLRTTPAHWQSALFAPAEPAAAPADPEAGLSAREAYQLLIHGRAELAEPAGGVPPAPGARFALTAAPGDRIVLRRAGSTDRAVLGGMSAWIAAGLPWRPGPT